MKKDYSEYRYSEYDKYKMQRANLQDVRLDYFVNSVHFNPEERELSIKVDGYNEHRPMEDDIIEYEKELAAREGREYVPRPHDFASEDSKELLAESQKRLDEMRKKYDFRPGDVAGIAVEDVGILDIPMINVFSDGRIFLHYGEGILDFIYADFRTPLQNQMELVQIENLLIQAAREKKTTADINQEQGERVRKIYSEAQEIVEDFYSYELTFSELEEVAYASLYTAICPPLFVDDRKRKIERLKWYGNYILRLQKEFKEMIEFCYDEDFYPDVLGKLYPSERLYIYRNSKGLPPFFYRTESVTLSKHSMGGKKMPFGIPSEELLKVFSDTRLDPTEEAKEFAEKYNLKPSSLMFDLKHPTFMRIEYQFSTVEDILELEFTKMLEQDIRFRKCKRCGKYFIMKGKYDTNYCDRVAEGETRNCQELAAIENYKAKIADNKAIPIYNKYYKRYAARVKVRQIKEADFKKWKYKALELRDQCSDGIITVEEYTAWMEASFPNRKPKE